MTNAIIGPTYKLLSEFDLKLIHHRSRADRLREHLITLRRCRHALRRGVATISVSVASPPCEPGCQRSS